MNAAAYQRVTSKQKNLSLDHSPRNRRAHFSSACVGTLFYLERVLLLLQTRLLFRETIQALLPVSANTRARTCTAAAEFVCMCLAVARPWSHMLFVARINCVVFR